MTRGMSEWVYFHDGDLQDVDVLAWGERPIVIAREDGELPRDQPSMVRLGDLRRWPEPQSLTGDRPT